MYLTTICSTGVLYLKRKSSELLKNQTFLAMKLSAIFVLAACLQLSAAGYSQRISISGHNMSLEKVFNEIQKQSGYLFFYSDKDLKKAHRVNVDTRKEEMKSVLDEIFLNQPLTYNIIGKTVVVKKAATAQPIVVEVKPTAVTGVVVVQKVITGKVTDKEGNVLEGVSVSVKGSKSGTTTNDKGLYSITIPDGTHVLVFSMVGYTSVEKVVSNETNLDIILDKKANDMGEVVITGYFTKTKQSVTGSQVSVTGDDLRKVGSANFMQALNAFDPSIRMAPNTAFGSDPNRVPDITIRGENGFDLRSSADDARSNPNAPLYLLDGIEVSATRVYDLDMNRIESFVILKDASATSLYGSRGANGVILITTVPPKQGAIRVSLNT